MKSHLDWSHFGGEFDKIDAAERDVRIAVDLILTAWWEFEATRDDWQCDCRLNDERDQRVETKDEAECVVREILRDLSCTNSDSEGIRNAIEDIEDVARHQWVTCCCKNDEDSLQRRHYDQDEQSAVLFLQEIHVNFSGKERNSSSKKCKSRINRSIVNHFLSVVNRNPKDLNVRSDLNVEAECDCVVKAPKHNRSMFVRSREVNPNEMKGICDAIVSEGLWQLSIVWISVEVETRLDRWNEESPDKRQYLCCKRISSISINLSFNVLIRVK